MNHHSFFIEHHSGFALWLLCGVCTNILLVHMRAIQAKFFMMAAGGKAHQDENNRFSSVLSNSSKSSFISPKILSLASNIIFQVCSPRCHNYQWKDWRSFLRILFNYESCYFTTILFQSVLHSLIFQLSLKSGC